jgi:hypothetical protein
MYCSSCGVSLKQSASYCNHCGAKVNGGKGEGHTKTSEVKAETLIAAMVVTFIFSMAAIMSLMSVMKRLDLAVGVILAITLLCFLIMLSLEGVFLWLILRRFRGAKETTDPALSKGQTTKELDAAQVRMLSEPVSSVTENTTRTLEPIYSERPSK